MRYIAITVIVAYLLSYLIMSGKAEVDILNAEIAEANRVLEESIGDPTLLPWKQSPNNSDTTTTAIGYTTNVATD